jgi:hypothetical protein
MCEPQHQAGHPQVLDAGNAQRSELGGEEEQGDEGEGGGAWEGEGAFEVVGG